MKTHLLLAITLSHLFGASLAAGQKVTVTLPHRNEIQPLVCGILVPEENLMYTTSRYKIVKEEETRTVVEFEIDADREIKNGYVYFPILPSWPLGMVQKKLPEKNADMSVELPAKVFTTKTLGRIEGMVAQEVVEGSDWQLRIFRVVPDPKGGTTYDPFFTSAYDVFQSEKAFRIDVNLMYFQPGIYDFCIDSTNEHGFLFRKRIEIKETDLAQIQTRDVMKGIGEAFSQAPPVWFGREELLIGPVKHGVAAFRRRIISLD